MTELATRILQTLTTFYEVGWSVGEGRISYDVKRHDPSIVDLYRFPHEFDAALRELAKAQFIEKHPILPDWTMLRFPKGA
jgi:hypothetical protein